MVFFFPSCNCSKNYLTYLVSQFITLCTVPAKAREPEQFLVLPNKLEEGESITLICSADIGSPLGNIQMWKKHHISNIYELIYTSNTTNNRTEDCTDSVNVTTTYTVTRKDNRALFRCSSQNNLTKDQLPSRESSTITVICMYLR